MTTFTPEKKGSWQNTRPPTSLAVRGNGQAWPPQPAPTHDQIAQCAYDIYIIHGRVEGRSELDWRQAEEELAQTPRVSWPKA
jgi:hypothetical protein